MPAFLSLVALVLLTTSLSWPLHLAKILGSRTIPKIHFSRNSASRLKSSQTPKLDHAIRGVHCLLEKRTTMMVVVDAAATSPRSCAEKIMMDFVVCRVIQRRLWQMLRMLL